MSSISVGNYPQNTAFVPFSAASSSSSPSSPSSAANPAASSFADLLETARDQASGESPASSGPGKTVINKTDKLYEQCLELETFLIKNLLTGMRNTVQKSGFIDEGFAGQMYEDMLWDEYAKDFTKNAGLGFAEMAYLELTGQRGKVLANHA